MHELSIMEQTLTIALEAAQQQQAKQIHRLTMRIGAISGVVPEALQFAFDVSSQSTIAAGGNLAIEIVPVLCHCQQCQQDFHPRDLFYQCPDCQLFSSQVVRGKEIELLSLEVS